MNIPTSEIGIPSINEDNHCEPNSVDISGALILLNSSILILSAQYREGTRDVNNIRVTMITNYLKKTFYRDWEDLLFPIEHMKITWQRYYLFDILEANNIDYDQILTIISRFKVPMWSLAEILPFVF